MTIYTYAKDLRNKSTLSEVLLWKKLKAKQLGYQFYRQRPLYNRYIADFYCAELNLVIEVDGGYHSLRVIEDSERDEFLKELGIVTLRFNNEDVLRNINAVLNKINSWIKDKNNLS